ncbi:MAG: hypothetical protein KAI47_11555 [Deltaproteobacteria bacterium]|nr:hypothetical protein [Deltaproteobacteria bacterium]
MMRRKFICEGARWFALTLLGAAFLLGACNNSSSPQSDGKISHDKGTTREDEGACPRPPLALCEPPPYGSACPTLWYCPGCLCAGPNKVAACNPVNQDCRYFCTGCYPEEYVLCDQKTATLYPQVAHRCGYCFMSKDAGVPERCNVIGPFDGGASPGHDAGVGDAK